MLLRSLSAVLVPTQLPAASSVLRRARKLAPLLVLAIVTFFVLRTDSHQHLIRPHFFSLPGRLNYEAGAPFETRFALDPGAEDHQVPPRLMEKLMLRLRGDEKAVVEAAEAALKKRLAGTKGRVDEREEADSLDWLQDRTVLLMGDSIDRYHLLHLCQFLSPAAPLIPLPWPHAKNEDFVTVVSPSTTPNLYPQRLIKLEDELAQTTRGGRPFGSEHSRPWICKVDQGGLDFWVVWTFWNGLDDGKDTPGIVAFNSTNPSDEGRAVFGDRAKGQPYGDRAFYPIESEHFHPPLSPEDRMLQIALPILKQLGRKVDFVELGIGAWDLGMFRSLDKLSVEEHITANPSTLSSSDLSKLASKLSSSPLSPARLAWYRRRLNAVLSLVTSSFPPRSSILSGQPVGPPRVSVRTMPVPPQSFEWPWVMSQARVLELEQVTREVVQAFGGGRAVFSEWAALLRESKEFLDHIHPSPIPGSWLWADMMLYELRRIVTGRS